MGARRSNGCTVSAPMGKDLSLIVAKSKQFYAPCGEFYLFTITTGDTPTYFTGSSNHTGTAIEHYTNVADHGQRAKWQGVRCND